jgi:hypothetical protein
MNGPAIPERIEGATGGRLGPMDVKGGDSQSLFFNFLRFSQRKNIAIPIRRRIMNAPTAAAAMRFPFVSAALYLSKEVSAARADDAVGLGGSMIGVTEKLIVVTVEMKFEDTVAIDIVVRLRMVAKVVVVETFKVTGGGHKTIPGIVQFGLKGIGGGGLRSPVSPPSCLFVYDIQFQLSNNNWIILPGFQSAGKRRYIALESVSSTKRM